MHASLTPGSEAGPRYCVLVVDDEHALLLLLRDALARDYDVEVAASAEEAELMMASRAYDAVVCDHLLPGELGLDFLVRASRRFPLTRRILLTGYVNPDFLSRSRGLASLSACIVKPARPEEVCAEVRRALDGGLRA